MISEEKLNKLASAPTPAERDRITNTRQVIEDCLKEHFPTSQIKEKYQMPLFKFPEIFVQGSYANSTNIPKESDIDIVIQVNEPFWTDKSQLTPQEARLHDLSHSPTKYDYTLFKNDVFTALKKIFGTDAKYDDKCIKIKESRRRIDADVVSAFQYRLYKRFISYENQDFIEGIKFINTKDSSEIINFPKIHLKNCEAKNVATKGKFKDLIRIYKNIKIDLVGTEKIKEEVAPNYFIENLLYNCSDACFIGNYKTCILESLQFLFDALKYGRLTGFICANEQYSLISQKTWNIIDAQSFILAISDYCLDN